MSAIVTKLLGLIGLSTPAELLSLLVEYGVYVLLPVVAFVAYVLRNTSHGAHLWVIVLVIAIGVGVKIGQTVKITL